MTAAIVLILGIVAVLVTGPAGITPPLLGSSQSDSEPMAEAASPIVRDAVLPTPVNPDGDGAELAMRSPWHNYGEGARTTSTTENDDTSAPSTTAAADSDDAVDSTSTTPSTRPPRAPKTTDPDYGTTTSATSPPSGATGSTATTQPPQTTTTTAKPTTTKKPTTTAKPSTTADVDRIGNPALWASPNSADNPPRVGLFWFHPTQNKDAITNYQIRRNGLLIATLSATTVAWADTTVSAGGAYTYTVRALSGDRGIADSFDSNPFSVTLPG